MIVDGVKMAQLMPMSMGPRFSSPEEGIISFLSIARRTVKPRRQSVQPSLAVFVVVACVVIGVVVEKRQAGEAGQVDHGGRGDGRDSSMGNWGIGLVLRHCRWR